LTVTTRLATPAEAFRMIIHEAWCPKHSSAADVARDALFGQLLIDVREDPDESPSWLGAHHCAQCQGN
jgi:hypothetical protein